MTKTYRGQLADGGQERLRLRTKNGKTGYRIVKLDIMSQEPYGSANGEHLVQVWSKEQSTIDANVDFSDSNLLAAAIGNNATSGYTYPNVTTVVFDNAIVNQDIYVTHNDNQSTLRCNYHIELETIDLSDAQAAQTTLKALRTVASR